jgi:hypothetical protein
VSKDTVPNIDNVATQRHEVAYRDFYLSIFVASDLLQLAVVWRKSGEYDL